MIVMELIDTHCHLDVEEFDADRLAVLTRAREAGVIAQLVPAIHADGWESLLELCAAESDLYPALGLHPVYLARHQETDLRALEQRIASDPPQAVGEIGLDFFLTGLDPDRQQFFFEAQLAIARDSQLPVVVHVRKAHDQVLRTLNSIGVGRGIIHAFNGSLDQGLRYFDLGFRLGFGGMLTFQRSSRLRRLARELPIESIVLETDAPDLTVASHHGERNSPEYLPEVLDALSEVRDEAPEVLAAQTSENARAVLGLPPAWA